MTNEEIEVKEVVAPKDIQSNSEIEGKEAPKEEIVAPKGVLSNSEIESKAEKESQDEVRAPEGVPSNSFHPETAFFFNSSLLPITSK